MHQYKKNSTISEEICMFDYLEIIVSSWRLIARITILSAVISIIIALLLPKKYSSTARILPPQQDVNLMGMMMGAGGGLSSLAGGMLGLGTPADQYASILKSERIGDAVIDRFKLMDVYKMDYRLDMYEKLNKLVDISAGKKDGIITISVEDEEPIRAAGIANAYIEELDKLTAEINMTGGSKSKLFFEKRLSQSRIDLANAEEEIRKFQKINKTIDVTEQAKASIVGIAELRAQLALQEIQLAGLSRRFTENSQEVKDTKTAISRIKGQINKLEGNSKGDVIPAVGSIPDMGQEYIRLMRDFKIQETLVELLTKQYELAKLNEAKDVTSIQIIQKAQVPDKKVKPKRRNLVLGITFVSFIFSIIYVMALNYIAMMPTNERLRWQRIRRLFTQKKINAVK